MCKQSGLPCATLLRFTSDPGGLSATACVVWRSLCVPEMPAALMPVLSGVVTRCRQELGNVEIKARQGVKVQRC